MLFLRDSIKASITNLNSGINEITLSNLASLRSLKTITELPAPDGIKEDITIMLSKIFQPSLKKSLLCFSEKNLIEISTTKNTVTKISLINKAFRKAPSKSYVLIPTTSDENKMTIVTEVWNKGCSLICCNIRVILL